MYFKTVVLLKQLVYQGGLFIKQIVSPVDYKDDLFSKAVVSLKRLLHQINTFFFRLE